MQFALLIEKLLVFDFSLCPSVKMIANNRSTSSTGNLTTRKKRNRWDSDEEEEDESSASHHGDVEASSSSSMRKEDALWKDEDSDGNAVSLCSEVTRQQSQKEEEKESKIEQTSICYYSPLLHGCRYVSDCYERLDVIAEGSYGIVWKARDVLSKEIVALKQIKNIATNEGFPILALREVQALLDLSHDCIVSVHEVVIGTSLDKVFMVFPVGPSHSYRTLFFSLTPS
jgi:cell division cycle 2-like protein